MTRFIAFLLMITLTACAGSGTAPGKKGSSKADNAAVTEAIKDGNVKQSLTLAEKAYKDNPGDSEAALNYATALRMAGRETQAKIILKEFSDKPSASAGVLNESARIALAEGQYQRAIATAKNATQLYGDNAESWNILGMAYDGGNKLKDAEAAYRKALELEPKNRAAILNNLALNLTLQEKLQKALPVIEEALELEPNKREYKRNRAMIRAMHAQVYHTVD